MENKIDRLDALYNKLYSLVDNKHQEAVSDIVAEIVGLEIETEKENIA